MTPLEHLRTQLGGRIITPIDKPINLAIDRWHVYAVGGEGGFTFDIWLGDTPRVYWADTTTVLRTIKGGGT